MGVFGVWFWFGVEGVIERIKNSLRLHFNVSSLLHDPDLEFEDQRAYIQSLV